MRANQIIVIVYVSLVSLIGIKAHAQQEPLKLQQLLQMAETNYPFIKSKMFEVQAAQKGVNASMSSFIPTLDASYQMNYATYNNIIGMAYPQYLIPISGPPSTMNNMNPVPGSDVSLLLNWQPITFGQRNAQVDYARAGLQYASADAQNEIFQHKIKVINAYLELLTATELVKLYQNNLNRTESNLKSVKSLVISGIKPGVDTLVFMAEVSKSKVELLNSKKLKEQSRIYLSQLLASDNNIYYTDTTFFTRLPVNLLLVDSVKHPLVNLYNSNIEIGLARKKMLAKTLFPIWGVWGTTYARGSGVSYNGDEKTTDGLGFQRYNYGLGIQVSVPLLQSVRIRSQLRQQDFLIQSNQEKLNEIELQLKKENELADTIINNSLAVVRESPLLLESAQFSYRALQSRYQSGLTNISDLMQAQYVLIKAETDNKLAYMNVWKAFLYKATVNGNLNTFIKQVN